MFCLFKNVILIYREFKTNTMNTNLLLSIFVLSVIVFIISATIDEKSWDWFILNRKTSNYDLYDLVTGISQFFIVVSFLSGGVSLFFSIVSLF